MLTIRLVFKNSKYNFTTSVNNNSEDMIINEHVGHYFNFTHLNSGDQKCINILFPFQ